ncbi:Stress-induced-phosphoprotein 1 [Trichinella britovi]|uniref:Stress-induced-phosphoprotein 1 n=1 Tax=Trichinella britovi TaxID=45882 RepID=A0A0V1CNH0_TRIBR|nr:Stress-induced-phosphoprotein 1 [Trichinella britovi]
MAVVFHSTFLYVDNMESAALKDAGNIALSQENYAEAIDLYTKAIKLDPNNYILYSNRSAAHAKNKNYDEALADAEKTIELKPDWAKGYSRKAAALSLLGKGVDAIYTLSTGLHYDPANIQLRESYKAELENSAGDLFQIFLDDAARKRLEGLYPKADVKRDDIPLDRLREILMDKLTQMDTDYSGNLKKESSSPKEPSPPPKETTPAQDKAMEEKNLGNACYKQRNFEAAHEHYDKAIELDPNNITLLNNKAAVYFEEGNYEKCIEFCTKAVDIGRENRADYSLIGKALARIGNAYVKLGDLKSALNFYDKSLSEHREPTVVKKRQAIAKQLAEDEKRAYYNPQLSLEEKEKGNQFFKEGKYPEAVKHYTEAIKRNPEDGKLYSNRAACYTKLMEFQMAVSDCEKCIKLDPTFIKAYIRKGAALMALKEPIRAMKAFEEALKIDPNNQVLLFSLQIVVTDLNNGEFQEAMNGMREAASACDQSPDEARKKALEDPEIREILADPAMVHILEQMSHNPQALREHLKNPEIAGKINKLIEAGVVRIR